MSKEITIKTSLVVTNGFTETHSNTIQIDQTTAGAVTKHQTIPTSDTVISLTGVTAPLIISIKNLDPTNYVEIGSTVAGAIALPGFKLGPGQSMLTPLGTSTVLRGKANTASVIIEYMIAEA